MDRSVGLEPTMSVTSLVSKTSAFPIWRRTDNKIKLSVRWDLNSQPPDSRSGTLPNWATHRYVDLDTIVCWRHTAFIDWKMVPWEGFEPSFCSNRERLLYKGRVLPIKLPRDIPLLIQKNGPETENRTQAFCM